MHTPTRQNEHFFHEGKPFMSKREAGVYIRAPDSILIEATSCALIHPLLRSSDEIVLSGARINGDIGTHTREEVRFVNLHNGTTRLITKGVKRILSTDALATFLETPHAQRTESGVEP